MADTYRKIRGLKLVRLATCPHPPERLRGAKLQGVRYEQRVGRALGGTLGQWFYFEDSNGPGHCQPDILLSGWIVEVKLSDTPAARGQIVDLYLPVVEHYFGGKWRGLKVVKALRPGSRDVVYCRAEAWALPAPRIPTLLWPGRGAIP